MAHRTMMIAPPDVESRADDHPVFEPGGVYFSPATNKWYRYVQVASGTPIVGQAAYWASANLPTGRLVTVTAAAASANALAGNANGVAGIFVNLIPATKWGFILTGGVTTCHFVGRTVGSGGLSVIASGGACSGTTSNLDVVAAGTAPGYRSVGVTLEAKDGTTHLARCLIWLDGAA